MEEMWLLQMKDAVTYYKKVTLRQMLKHLTNRSSGLEATDIVGLQASIIGWWDEYLRIPEYIK